MRGRKKTGRITACENCGTDFYLRASEEKRGKKCCSIKCRDEAKRKLIYDDANKQRKCACCGLWKSYGEYSATNGEKSGKNSLQAYCAPCSTKKSVEWSKDNSDRRNELNRKSYKANAAVIRERQRNLSPERRQKKNERAKQYRHDNNEKVRMWNKVRVHRKRAAGKMPSLCSLNKLLCAQDAKCVYCGSLLNWNTHLDHKTPIKRGGMNDIGNLQWLCATCNMKKSISTHEEYAARVGMYPLAPSVLPSWFDAEAFADAMESSDYKKAILLCRSAS